MRIEKNAGTKPKGNSVFRLLTVMCHAVAIMDLADFRNGTNVPSIVREK